ncbi:MAG TPA: TIGR03915 family putative DNA repair protein [Bacillota bacterium]|nr:TIGR03915 family putative DNA repair protein [Bacillota bacterium]
MAAFQQVIYLYDGTFPGLLCCVHESLHQDCLPEDICPEDSAMLYLYPSQRVATDETKAINVQRWIREHCGEEVLRFARHVFLTCLPQREIRLLRFLHLARERGPRVLDMLHHADVLPLHKAVLHLRRESHLLKGFVRFSLRQGVLSATIGPKNLVLPLLAEHFCTRFAGERFLIYDSTNSMVLMHDPPHTELMSVVGVDLPDKDAGEEGIETMWRLFYNTIAVPGRENSRLRMSLMPKRYWRYMTEFQK